MATTTQPAERPVEVEFRVRDRDCFFIEASATADCQVRLEHVVNRSDGRLLEYFTVENVAPDRVLSMASDTAAITDARLVSRGVDGGLFEFVVSGPCVTTTLADTGAVAQSVAATEGVGHVIASVPAHVQVRRVVERFCERHARAELVGRRDGGEVPVQTKRGAQAALTDRLTEKQLEVLRTAYLGGYFAWPRKSTAEDCARALGVAQPTFSQHLRVAQEKVFGDIFDGVEPDHLSS